MHTFHLLLLAFFHVSLSSTEVPDPASMPATSPIHQEIRSVSTPSHVQHIPFSPSITPTLAKSPSQTSIKIDKPEIAFLNRRASGVKLLGIFQQLQQSSTPKTPEPRQAQPKKMKRDSEIAITLNSLLKKPSQTQKEDSSKEAFDQTKEGQATLESSKETEVSTSKDLKPALKPRLSKDYNRRGSSRFKKLFSKATPLKVKSKGASIVAIEPTTTTKETTGAEVTTAFETPENSPKKPDSIPKESVMETPTKTRVESLEEMETMAPGRESSFKLNLEMIDGVNLMSGLKAVKDRTEIEASLNKVLAACIPDFQTGDALQLLRLHRTYLHALLVRFADTHQDLFKPLLRIVKPKDIEFDMLRDFVDFNMSLKDVNEQVVYRSACVAVQTYKTLMSEVFEKFEFEDLMGYYLIRLMGEFVEEMHDKLISDGDEYWKRASSYIKVNYVLRLTPKVVRFLMEESD